MNKRINSIVVGVLVFALNSSAIADGSVIDKVYHPYVELLEWEIEWRMIYEQAGTTKSESHNQVHRLGVGKALSEFVFAEVYLIGERSNDNSLDIDAYEFELMWQLSEQGEYALDYGLLFEVEHESDEDIWEYATALLLEKEFGRYSVTANLAVIYERGDSIRNEWESAASLQARYRYSQRFEPAIEAYFGEDTQAIGPVFLGLERLGNATALRWEAGIVFGLDNETPDYTVRAVLEYEF
ncbi:MAG: hypothetical protein AB8B81_11325 [Halioglobus sp.]